LQPATSRKWLSQHGRCADAEVEALASIWLLIGAVKKWSATPKQQAACKYPFLM
jgi:hypothetical protein